jgi:hypothetical protein
MKNKTIMFDKVFEDFHETLKAVRKWQKSMLVEKLKLVPKKYLMIAGIIALAFLALIIGSIQSSPGITLRNATVFGSLQIDDALSVPIKDAQLRVSSGEPIIFKTGGRKINTTGTITMQNVDGTLKWTGRQFVIQGTMESVQGTGISITWTRTERTSVSFANGTIDITGLQLPGLNRKGKGTLSLERKLTLQLNNTPISINDFEGRLYIQHIDGQTSVSLDGNAEELKVRHKNIFTIVR